MGLDCLPIEKTVDLNLNYPTVSERYFSHCYFVPKNPKKKTFVKPNQLVSPSERDIDSNLSKVENAAENKVVAWQPNGEDTCIMIHSNRICVVCLPPNHPVTKHKKTVAKVDFCVDGFDRLANKVSGKGKRGAQVVGLFSPLCKIYCEDDSTYIVFTGIRGKLIEVNERLLLNPHLIAQAPNAEGYLAVVLPKLNKSEEYKEFLLPKDEYQALYSQF